VSNKLQNLHSKELDRIRKAFIKNSHTRLLKSFLYHLPFGTKGAYAKEIMGGSEQACKSNQDLRVPDADKDLLDLDEKTRKKTDVARNISAMIQDQIPVTMP